MTTINKKEIEKFSKLAKDWWNPNGKLKPLHLFNPVRIKFIKDKLIFNFKLKSNNPKPLKGLKILDIGCGGGLLCEPLSKLGAEVTGIDASDKNIKIAKLHSREMKCKIKYICCAPENLKIKNKFDVVLNMEVIEHVENVNMFIGSCAKLIKKDGVMFVATINKNLKSFLFGIVGAEYVLRWLPVGTHEWNKFLTPKDLNSIMKNNSFYLDETVGVKFNLFTNTWNISNDTSVNYISTFFKN